MNKILHLIILPFTGLGIIEYRGDSWFEYRKDIFKNYTLKSLANQTNKDFVIWCCFRKEEELNPITKQIEEEIKETGLKYIFTFDGIMMHDDRGVWHNQDLRERMKRSLGVVECQVEPTDWVYATDLGSDDMFSEEAFEEIKNIEPKLRGAGYYLNGYVVDVENNRVAEWNRTSSGPQYTIIFPYNTFFDVDKHLEYAKGLTSHEFASTAFDSVRLPDKRYMCSVHRGNISTTFDNQFRGKMFNDIEKKEIFKKFGLL